MNRLTTNQIKFYCSLSQKKFRDQNQLFLAEGHKITTEFLNQTHFTIHSILATEKWFTQNTILVQDYISNSYHCSPNEIDRISLFKNAPEVILILKYNTTIFRPTEGIHLFLDRLQDPGNVGTIIRIADWFNIQSIASFGSVDFYNPKVVQSSMGSLSRVPFKEIDFTNFQKLLPNHTTISTSLQGNLLQNTIIPKHCIIVIGNEGKGIDLEIEKKSELNVRIEKFGEAESLNAAVACGIICSYIRMKQ
jgi:TrmH family RNA methyltransferase